MKLTAYVHLKETFGSFEVAIFAMDMSTCGYQLLGTHDFDFDVPDLDDVSLKIAHIEQQKEVLKRAFYSRLEELNTKLATLQCLEMTP